MRVHLNIGVQFTQSSNLLKAIRLNKRVYGRNNVVAPSVRLYRPKIEEFISNLDGLPPTAKESRALLEELSEGQQAQAMILVDERPCGPLNQAFEETMLLPYLGDNLARTAELFAAADLHVSLALINPASFVGRTLTHKGAHGPASWFARNIAPSDVSWIPAVDRIQAALPGVPLTMWTEEDLPFLWSKILRHLGGLEDDTPLRAPYLPLQNSLTPEGVDRLNAFVRTFPPKSQSAYERMALAFLDKYEAPLTVGPEEGIEGWDDAALDVISAGYEDDIAELSGREGITFFQPELAQSEV